MIRITVGHRPTTDYDAIVVGGGYKRSGRGTACRPPPTSCRCCSRRWSPTCGFGPPDIERRIGLTGGNIFQGETMPDQMWEHRLPSRSALQGVYLCGAATHPAASVIALNGRNAAMAVLEDAQVRVTA